VHGDLAKACAPVGFSSNIVPEQWRLLYSINPIVGVIDGFRWFILGEQSQLYLPGLATSFCSTVFFLWLRLPSVQKDGKDLRRLDLTTAA
jgi:lipopolysaccharide transport system permease protein